jgi:adenosylmethionine-8-amino-7-oxononanoate aminotransferase
MVKKMEFIFGDIAMTLTPDDIEAVLQEWETKHPGKVAALIVEAVNRSGGLSPVPNGDRA